VEFGVPLMGTANDSVNGRIKMFFAILMDVQSSSGAGLQRISNDDAFPGLMSNSKRLFLVVTKEKVGKLMCRLLLDLTTEQSW